ncbi:hypothetical protein EJB05_56064, partial [Eragrostis curvula]
MADWRAPPCPVRTSCGVWCYSPDLPRLLPGTHEGFDGYNHKIYNRTAASNPPTKQGIGMSLATTTQPMGRVDISVSGLTRYQNWLALLLRLKQELGPTTSSWGHCDDETTSGMAFMIPNLRSLCRHQELGGPGLCHAQNTITASQVHRMMEGCLKAGMGTRSQQESNKGKIWLPAMLPLPFPAISALANFVASSRRSFEPLLCAVLVVAGGVAPGLLPQASLAMEEDAARTAPLPVEQRAATQAPSPPVAVLR